jgi:hypothetical protein
MSNARYAIAVEGLGSPLECLDEAEWIAAEASLGLSVVFDKRWGD